MRSCWASSGFSSMLILTRRTLPAALLTTRSSSGVSCLHGLHHGAQKSTITGWSRDAWMTSAMKRCAVAVLDQRAVGFAVAPPDPIRPESKPIPPRTPRQMRATGCG